MKVSNEMHAKLPVKFRDFAEVLIVWGIAAGVNSIRFPENTFSSFLTSDPAGFFVIFKILFGVLAIVASIHLAYEWNLRNRDGWVMIITRKEHKLLSDDKPADAIVFIVGHKRISEFRHVPYGAYDDAILVAMNPKHRVVTFENGYKQIHLTFHISGSSGYVKADCGHAHFTFWDEESLWAFEKENPHYFESMRSAESIMDKLQELDDRVQRGEAEKLVILKFLKEVEERLANRKTFGRAVGALDLRAKILNEIMAHATDDAFREEVRIDLYDLSDELGARELGRGRSPLVADA